MLNKKLILLLFAIFSITLTGCNEKNYTSGNQEVSPDSPSREQPSSNAADSQPDSPRSMEGLFSDRDKEIGYDESEAVQINLDGSTASCDSPSVSISGASITISGEGTYLLSGSLNHGMVIVDAGKEDKIQLVLNGASIQCDSSAPIYVKQADKVFLTLADGSENTLSASGEFAAIDDNTIDAAIFSKDDLTLNGTGMLKIESKYGHGIVSKDSLVITSGTYQITAARHGLSGKDNVSILNGDFTLDAGKDGIHGANGDDASLGFIFLAGGTFHITAGDDGLHSDADLTIQDGTVQIAKSYEGIEGKVIDIRGGTITVTAEDDGLNASGGNGSESGRNMKQKQDAASDSSIYICISGGSLCVDAGGDGLDSNGNLFVEGGEIFVSGSQKGGNGALDYNGEAKITGGTVAAAGFADMAQNFGENSTQGTILVSFSVQDAGTEVSLTDSENRTLLSYAPAKQYDSVVFSHPGLVAGNSYTVHYGEEHTDIAMDTLVYGNGQGMHGGFNSRGSRKGRHGTQEGEPRELPDGELPQNEQAVPQMPEGEMLQNGQEPTGLPDSGMPEGEPL